jgi:CRISPR-associated endonuclease Csn1
MLDGEGRRIPLIAKGDSIRGQLHKESFYGAIDHRGEKILVERYSIASFTTINDCRHIIDDAVRDIVQSTLEERMVNGEPFDKAKLSPIPFPTGKAVIKKVRCKVAAGRGYLTLEKALEVHRHDFISRHNYKRHIYAQNEENTICLYYENNIDEKVERAFRIVGLYELAQLKIISFEEFKKENYYNTIEIGRGKSKKKLLLDSIITVGLKIIPYLNNIDELKELQYKNLLRRIFRIYKFNEPAPSTTYIYLQNHLEARKNEELGNGDNSVDFEKYQSRIFLSASKFNCAIEGKDFDVTIDGQIQWKF